MILKRSDRFRWAWSTINDENRFKSKDHLFIYFQINNNGK